MRVMKTTRPNTVSSTSGEYGVLQERLGTDSLGPRVHEPVAITNDFSSRDAHHPQMVEIRGGNSKQSDH